MQQQTVFTLTGYNFKKITLKINYFERLTMWNNYLQMDQVWKNLLDFKNNYESNFEWNNFERELRKVRPSSPEGGNIRPLGHIRPEMAS